MRVRSVNIGDGDVLLVPGDLHFDAHDPAAVALMLRVARAFRVNTVALVGDTFESAGVSRHGRPGRKFRFGHGTVRAEREAAEPYLSAMEAMVLHNRGAPGGLHVLTGNHEAWWAGVQDEYPGLEDTPWFELYDDLFDGWHVHAEYTALRFGPLLVCHGHRLRGSLSKYSAAAVLANYPGQNTIYGHTHRVDSCITPSYRFGSPVLHGAWGIGHLKDPVEEMKETYHGGLAERHRQGFALVFFHEVDHELRFQVEQAVIDRAPGGAVYCIVGGVLFS